MAPTYSQLRKAKKNEKARKNRSDKRAAKREAKGTNKSPNDFLASRAAAQQAKLKRQIKAASKMLVPADVELDTLKTDQNPAYAMVIHDPVPRKRKTLFENRIIWHNHLHTKYTFDTSFRVCSKNFAVHEIGHRFNFFDQYRGLHQLYYYAIAGFQKAQTELCGFTAREDFIKAWMTCPDDIPLVESKAMQKIKAKVQPSLDAVEELLEGLVLDAKLEDVMADMTLDQSQTQSAPAVPTESSGDDATTDSEVDTSEETEPANWDDLTEEGKFGAWIVRMYKEVHEEIAWMCQNIRTEEDLIAQNLTLELPKVQDFDFLQFSGNPRVRKLVQQLQIKWADAVKNVTRKVLGLDEIEQQAMERLAKEEQQAMEVDQAMEE